MVSKGEMWVLTRTASRSHIVKSGQAHIGLITGTRNSFFRVFQLMQNLSCYIPQKDSLGGWMVAAQVCLNVTARCSYESYVCLS